MVDGIDTGDRFEAGVGEWELLVRVHNSKIRTAFNTTLSCKGACRRDCLFVHIDSCHRAMGDNRHSKRWPPGSASHIKETVSGAQPQPIQKSILLVRSEPAILSNVFAKSFSP